MTGGRQHRTSHDSSAESLVEAIRSKAEDIRREELSRADGRWEAVPSDDRRRIDRLTQGIVTALLDGPSARLLAGGEIDPAYADSVRHLFGLEGSRGDAEVETSPNPSQAGSKNLF